MRKIYASVQIDNCIIRLVLDLAMNPFGPDNLEKLHRKQIDQWIPHWDFTYCRSYGSKMQSLCTKRLAKVRSRCPMNYFQWMWFAWLPVCHLRNLSKHLICFTVGIQGDMQNSIPDQPHHPPLNITRKNGWVPCSSCLRGR
ncbi:hypothetical protein SUGI_0096970 [Cryptomeria japonica]|nr:hypothetical protein SUGI_0096970 [Cryptomeria japonica]